MNFKVTVELEEGVKKTIDYTLTAEHLFILQSRKNLESGYSELDQSFIKAAGAAATSAAMDIVDWFRKEGTILAQRNKNGVRECLRVQDIDGAKDWIREGD
jgi:hypothetical protein